MKLLRLNLDDAFRSLPKGFEIHFLREWEFENYDQFNPYCLAGLNGSGKSNVLEALVAIFYHIEAIHLVNKPAEFEPDPEIKSKGFDSRVCTPNAFELEYLIPDDQTQKRSPIVNYYKGQLLAHIRIVKKKNEAPKVFHSPSFPELLDGEELEGLKIKSYLPAFILGYSSGHNEILSLPFLKMRFIHFDEYCHHLRESTPYNGSPEGRMIYLDEQYSQAILLCHYLFPTEVIQKVFRERVKIEKITQFRIIIRRCQRIELSDQRRKMMTKEERENSFLTHPELTSLLSKGNVDSNSQLGVIEKFIKCSTTHYEDFNAHPDDDSYDLYLDYWINDATLKAFALHFGEGASGSGDQAKAASALNLFQAFQTLLTLNLYEIDLDGATKRELYESTSLYVNETIHTPASHDRIMRFKEGSFKKKGLNEKLYIKSLSDGEYQLIHTIGLCLLFRHKPCLFLLDEPETHLNPGWRASYISTLRDALEVVESDRPPVLRDVLLTSHSPFVVSDCRQENVLVFEKNEKTGVVSCDRPEFNTFGASANTITMKIFNQSDTIGDYAAEALSKFRRRLKSGDDPNALIEEASTLLGESIEKVIFVNEALDMMPKE